MNQRRMQRVSQTVTVQRALDAGRKALQSLFHQRLQFARQRLDAVVFTQGVFELMGGSV
ncbi:hypothetical protein ACFSC4_13145 [Deinococcus malanensis]|uniref:hypothetical protein n=1 Tax=Deinococcus malanensis TaxID=1706855 RepID=UPI00364200FF